MRRARKTIASYTEIECWLSFNAPQDAHRYLLFAPRAINPIIAHARDDAGGQCSHIHRNLVLSRSHDRTKRTSAERPWTIHGGLSNAGATQARIDHPRRSISVPYNLGCSVTATVNEFRRPSNWTTERTTSRRFCGSSNAIVLCMYVILLCGSVFAGVERFSSQPPIFDWSLWRWMDMSIVAMSLMTHRLILSWIWGEMTSLVVRGSIREYERNPGRGVVV